jgi:RNA polymerase sigma factor (sigma-70 family)
MTNQQIMRWLMGVVRNKCRERGRHERAQCRDWRRVASVESLDLAAPESEPPFGSEVMDRYEAALARLPERDRRLLLGRQDLRSYEKLGAELGLSAEAARKRYERAFKRLKRDLGVSDEEPPSRGENPTGEDDV